MQTTLLGLAIAIILALVAALVGPLFIDWGSHRSLFEAEAGRLIGLNVHVAGAIDARLLPSPRLTLHDIAIGNGRDTIRARSLGVEFALGPLMRGEWRAAELHIEGPQLSLGLDQGGHIQAPNLAVSFRPDELSVDRLSIVDGTIALADARSGASVTLSRLWFNGEARSLLGPVKGEGAATIAGELYPYRLSVGRLSDESSLKLHVNVDPVEHPLSIEADGLMTFAAGAPRFEGTLGLSRPVGISGKSPGAPVEALTQPWRASAKVKATPQSALLQNVDLQYGSEDQGYRMTGVADFKFGAHPRFDGVLSGRQIDIDRASGGRQSPVAAIRRFAALGALAIRPALPVQIGIGIDQVTLGGNSVQELRGDISSNGHGWTLDRFEFRAPGLTKVKLSGQLAREGDKTSFTGPAEVDASDPKVLAAWLEGRSDPARGGLRPLKLRGDVTLAPGKVAIDRLQVEIDRRPMTGRLAYSFEAGDQDARLDAELKAPQVDVDTVLDFGSALFAGSGLTQPQEMTLAADIGRVTFSGVDARDAHVHVKIDANGLQLDQLSIGDLGGGRVSATGRIDTGGHAPRGTLSLDLETKQVAALAAVGSKFAPELSGQAADVLTRTRHARLHASLDVAGGETGSESNARLTVSGTLDSLRINTLVQANGDWANRRLSGAELSAAIDADDGPSLAALLGIGPFVAVGKGPGQLNIKVARSAKGNATLDLRLAAGGLAAEVTGAGQSAGGNLAGTGNLKVVQASLRPLGPVAGDSDSMGLPVKLAARVKVAGEQIAFDDIDATIDESKIRGRLSIGGGSPRRVDGAIEADSGSLPALIRSVTGSVPVTSTSNGWSWSRDAFVSAAFGKFSGKISLEFGRAELLPAVAARQVQATLQFDKDTISLQDVKGELSGGELAGTLSLQSVEDGLAARARISLEHADVAALLSSSARPAISGVGGLTLEFAGTGMSPTALVGALKGTGKLTLTDAALAGLDPRAFDAVTRAVDQGLPIETGRISDIVVKTIESGQLNVKRAELPVTLAAGQIRLSKATVEANDAALSVAGALDLTDGVLDARLVLSGQSEAAGARPDIFIALKGPVQAPSRKIDVSALTGWLTLRAVENQTKRLRAIENVPVQPVAPAPKRKSAPALPAPIDIKPAPKPRSAGQGAASIRSQY